MLLRAESRQAFGKKFPPISKNSNLLLTHVIFSPVYCSTVLLSSITRRVGVVRPVWPVFNEARHNHMRTNQRTAELKSRCLASAATRFSLGSHTSTQLPFSTACQQQPRRNRRVLFSHHIFFQRSQRRARLC